MLSGPLQLVLSHRLDWLSLSTAFAINPSLGLSHIFLMAISIGMHVSLADLASVASPHALTISQHNRELPTSYKWLAQVELRSDFHVFVATIPTLRETPVDITVV